MVRAASWGTLEALPGIAVTRLDLDRRDYERWVEQYVPDWRARFADIRQKKLLEFFASFTLLAPEPAHVFMDAGGGMHTYLPRLRTARRYMQDIRIVPGVRKALGDDIGYLECDAANIPLPAGSVDRIACHHAFEHFQGTSDVSFITEVQRLLAPGGRCCIVPLFVSDRYAEVTDTLSLGRKFDRRSTRVIDPTASIPGGKWSGNYARIYDTQAVRERLIANVRSGEFTMTVAQLRLDGELVPDLTLPCHAHVSAINRPYLALLLERR